MKKFLLAFVPALFFSACADSETISLKGKSYALISDKNITISFDDRKNEFYGQALNNYFGSYKLNGNKIELNIIGSTMMAGSPEEMAAERAYFENLAKIRTFAQTGKTLELKGEGVTLRYQEQ